MLKSFFSFIFFTSEVFSSPFGNDGISTGKRFQSVSLLYIKRKSTKKHKNIALKVVCLQFSAIFLPFTSAFLCATTKSRKEKNSETFQPIIGALLAENLSSRSTFCFVSRKAFLLFCRKKKNPDSRQGLSVLEYCR